jgi:N-sulfoglucosamine sulfohydrolase
MSFRALLIITLSVFTGTVGNCLADDGAKMNVLLITADDLGLQLSCYGDPYIKTPHLDTLANEGVRFRTAYVTQASCSSSRSSMFTGLYPHTTGQVGLANAGFTLNPSQIGKNLPRDLKTAGYRTGILGKLHVAPESSFPFDYRPKNGDTRDVRRVAEDAAKFFSADDEQPFFLMVNYSDPHFYKDRKNNRPGFPPQWKGIPEDPIAEDTVPGWDFQGFDEPVARRRASNFYNTVKRLDVGVGMLLAKLEAAGRAEDTLVIFLGDHGPPFNRGKTTCYESGLRVPFLVRWPGVSKAGVESSALVSAVDIAPTILDATGASTDREMHGKSLRPALSGVQSPEGWRQHLVGEFHYHGAQPFFPRRAVRGGQFKLIHNPLAGKAKPNFRVDGDPIADAATSEKYRDTAAGRAFHRYMDPPEWELYDLQNDPVEFYNLIEDPALAAEVERLKNALRSWQVETKDPLADPENFDKFRAKGAAAAKRMPR